MSSPALTVVLFTRTSYEVLRRTMRHLRAQTVREQLEVLITAPVAAQVRPDAGALDGFAHVEIIEVGQVETLAAAQVAGIERATAPVVVIGEDHSFPEPGWAAALIAAHRQDVAAVGPAMGNANPRTLTSWGNYIPYFGGWPASRTAGCAEQLPGHNTAYKRAVLRHYRDQLTFFLAAEAVFHQQLRQDGYQLYFEPAARTQHVNFSRFGWSTLQSLCGARLYGGSRAARERWPWSRRLFYIVGSPLIPVVRLRRMIASMRQCDEQRRWLPRLLPVLVWGALFHAWGEITGYALGVGDAEKRCLDFETDRLRYVTARDRQELTSE